MIICTEKYTESDKRIQNRNLLSKLHKQYQNTFEKQTRRKIKNRRNPNNQFYFVIYIVSKIHILHILYNLYNLYFFILYIYIYIYTHVHV